MLNRALAFPITSVVKGDRSMNKQILTIEEIMDIVKPLAEKYHITKRNLPLNHLRYTMIKMSRGFRLDSFLLCKSIRRLLYLVSPH